MFMHGPSFNKYKVLRIPLTPVGVLARRAAHARLSASQCWRWNQSKTARQAGQIAALEMEPRHWKQHDDEHEDDEHDDDEYVDDEHNADGEIMLTLSSVA